MMTYYEDSPQFTDATRRNIIGTLYLIVALLGICLNLATLTVLPECEKTLTRPLFVLFCVQLFTNIAALLCVGIPVPYMIAINKPYFLNPILIRAPGILLTITLILSFAIQFWICVFRNTVIVFKGLTAYLFSDASLYAIHFLSVVFAINRVIDISSNTDIRTFSVSSLSFQQTTSEYLSLASIVVYVGMASLMFYALSFFDLCYRHIYADQEEYEPHMKPLRRLYFQLLHLVCDVIFVFLFILPPIEASGSLVTIHSFLSIYGTILWPTVSLIIYSEQIRRELSHRIHLMMKGNQTTSQESFRARPSTEHRFRII